MIDNENIEIFRDNNPFLYTGITDDTIGVSFDKESANTGDVVCITQLYDELIRRFGSYKNAKDVYGFAQSMLVKGGYSTFGTRESIPYLNFTVYLEQDIIDEGILTPYVENWIPGKRYYIGDTVYYSLDGTTDGIKTYTLASCKEGYDYFDGYYDNKSRLTYFDNIGSDGKLIVHSNGNLEHWHENVSVCAESSYSGITAKTESLLRNVVRRKADMDISGNTLPFILHYDVIPIENPDPDSTITYTRRVLDTTTTETFYMCGYVNINYDPVYGKIVCDELESVIFYNSNDEENPVATFNVDNSLNKPILITKQGNDICVYAENLQKIAITNCDTIKFIYYIGATIDGQNNVWIRVANTGVRYEETRPLSLMEDDFTIEVGEDGVVYNFPYINVKTNSQEQSDTNNIDLNIAMRTVDYSSINVSSAQTGGDYYLNVKVFKDDSTIGLQNITENIDVKIERGIAESFQKHNMLGEICSLQDLENYKNGKYLK